MKKVLLGLVALSSLSFAQNTYINAKIGTNIGSEYTSVSDGDGKLMNDETKDTGFEIAIESFQSINENVDLGVGIAYQKHNSRKSNTQYFSDYDGEHSITYKGGEYKSIPVYLTGKYNFVNSSAITPYVKANLGYSFNFDSSNVKIHDETGASDIISTSVDNGLYWSLGAGAEYKNVTVDLAYGVTKAKLKDDVGDKIRADFERVTLSVGYNFNI